MYIINKYGSHTCLHVREGWHRITEFEDATNVSGAAYGATSPDGFCGHIGTPGTLASFNVPLLPFWNPCVIILASC